MDATLSALREAGLPGRALILEITESNLATAENADALPSQLLRLRANGVRIAIDAFGIGHSSLSYVGKLPVDLVKIDIAFTRVSDVTDDLSHEWGFVRGILRMVTDLRILAVAEGVETAAQAEALRTIGCPLAQGHHYGDPAPAAAIDRTLSRSDASFATQSAVPRPPRTN